MKPILFLIISCLALRNGKGAPKRAAYKFVRCNPEGDQSNCVTHQSEEMVWHPDLLSKLPASYTQYLKAKPVEEEEEEEEKERDNDKEEISISDEQESPALDGSAYYEGSAIDFLSEDQPLVTAESETGSGENEKPSKGRDMMSRSWFFHQAKPEDREMREDQLLKL